MTPNRRVFATSGHRLRPHHGQDPRRRSHASRSLALGVVIAVLCALIGPAARAEEQPTPTAVSVLVGSSPVTEITYGQAATVRASGTCAAGTWLTIWTRINLSHPWRQWHSAQVGSTCGATKAIPVMPTGHHSYAAALSSSRPDPKTPPNATTLSKATSVAIVPRSFTSTLSHTWVDATQNVTLTVKGGTESAGQRVRIHALRGGVWAELTSVHLNAAGTASLTITEGRGTGGKYILRALLQIGPRAVRAPDRQFERITSVQAAVTNTTSAEVAHTYRAGCPVGPSGLSTIRMYYRAYDGTIRRGELVVKRSLASRYVAAFNEAFTKGWRISSMISANNWLGDDVKIMRAGNTTAFNCRAVVGNPYALSPHSYGHALDTNQKQNPYRDPQGRWYPDATYATWRPASVTGLMTPTSPMVTAMKSRGFAWYSGWDWHHFQYGS